MPLWTAGNRLVLPKRDYSRRVLATRPYALVGYWPIDDLVGTTARNLAWPQTQLLANAGFELAGAAPPVFADWAQTLSNGAIARTTVAGEFRSGAAAAKLTAGGAALTAINQTFPVLPGQYYTLSIWTRGDGTNAGRYLVYDVTNGANIIAATSTGVTGATYAEVSTGFTAPAGCISARLYLYCPTVSSGIAYFDDVTVSRNLDGAYTGVDLTNVLGPFGRPCPYFDGANDYLDVYTTPVANEFSGVELTIAAWCRVNSATVWADTALHRVFFVGTASSSIRVQKFDVGGGVGAISFYSTADGTTVFRNSSNLTRSDWIHVAITRSESAGEVRAYLDGVQVGATLTSIGIWAGSLSSTACCFGAGSTTPIQVWHGWLAHGAAWRVALSAAEIANLARR